MHLIIYLQGANIHYIKRNDVLKIQFNFIIEHLIFVEAHVQTSNPPLIFTHLRCEILTTRLFSKREREMIPTIELRERNAYMEVVSLKSYNQPT